MSHLLIKKKKIRKLKMPATYNPQRIQIGVPVLDDEGRKVNLNNPGDTVLPSALFGPACGRNANGYTYVDTTQPKENRYVTTISIQPYGNPNASPVATDIYRKCYPRVDVPPTEIELILVKNTNEQLYVIANLTEEVRKNFLVETVNLFLEIYGICYIFCDEIKISDSAIRRRCNWEILPPGEKPSVHLLNNLRQYGDNVTTLDIERLEMLEQFAVKEIIEGTNGFEGYFAYIFSNHCVLESALYGNATYIIPKENWEVLSQKTKKELLDEKIVIEKVIHSKNWKSNIRSIIRRLENQ